MTKENAIMTAPEWLQGEQIDEEAFVDAYLAAHPMKCVGGRLFTVDGPVEEEESIRSNIYFMIRNYKKSGASKHAAALLDTIRTAAYSEPLPIQQDRIHVANGTYFLGDGFVPHKEFCMNRLCVPYNEEAPEPVRWLTFLSELLYEDDIPTLQEFMGYLLIPSTRAQKMLILIGRGGEGKSRIGCVLRSIFGDSMNTCSLQKIETNRFSRADLEFKLLSLDDDMQMEALPKTNVIKTLVTNEGKIDIERKCIQSVQRQLYARLMCFSNGALTAKYDNSYAFYRRQLIIHVRDKNEDRIDDPYLAEKLIGEREGIFMWMLEGLKRLIGNDYRFTVSERGNKQLEAAARQATSVQCFMKSDYVSYGANKKVLTTALYEAYLDWCEQNDVEGINYIPFAKRLAEMEDELEISASKHIDGDKRGFVGVGIASEK